MKYKLPEGWERVKLGDIAGLNSINYRKNDGWKFVNYLDTGNITNNIIDTISFIDLEKGNLPSRARRRVFKDDIIYSTVRPIQKHLGIIKKPLDNMLVSTGFTVITVDKNRVEPYFIYLYLSQNSLTNHLQSIAEQRVSTYPALNISDIETLNINLPPLQEQKSIASTLSALDDKIELNNKINENLEAQAQAIFKHWFVDFEFPDENGNPYKSSGGQMVESEMGMIPKGWEVGGFKDIVEFKNGYGFRSKELSEQPILDGYKVFKMGDIKIGGGLNQNKTKHWITRKYLKNNNLEKYLAQKGDLLMCMTDMKNSMKLLGHTALIPFNDVYVVNQRVGHITAKNNVGIDYAYLYFLTNSNKFIEELRSRSNSGVQVNLTTTAIKNTRVVIGKRKINCKVNKILKPIVEKIFLLEKQNQTLSQLRDTLLPKLISGEIRLPLD